MAPYDNSQGVRTIRGRLVKLKIVVFLVKHVLFIISIQFKNYVHYHFNFSKLNESKGWNESGWGLEKLSKIIMKRGMIIRYSRVTLCWFILLQMILHIWDSSPDFKF